MGPPSPDVSRRSRPGSGPRPAPATSACRCMIAFGSPGAGDRRRAGPRHTPPSGYTSAPPACRRPASHSLSWHESRSRAWQVTLTEPEIAQNKHNNDDDTDDSEDVHATLLLLLGTRKLCAKPGSSRSSSSRWPGSRRPRRRRGNCLRSPRAAPQPPPPYRLAKLKIQPSYSGPSRHHIHAGRSASARHE